MATSWEGVPPAAARTSPYRCHVPFSNRIAWNRPPVTVVTARCRVVPDAVTATESTTPGTPVSPPTSPQPVHRRCTRGAPDPPLREQLAQTRRARLAEHARHRPVPSSRFPNRCPRFETYQDACYAVNPQRTAAAV